MEVASSVSVDGEGAAPLYDRAHHPLYLSGADGLLRGEGHLTVQIGRICQLLATLNERLQIFSNLEGSISAVLKPIFASE